MGSGVKSGSFIALFSPVSSPDGVDQTIKRLSERGYELVLHEAVYDERGLLKSFAINMTSYFREELFSSNATIDFAYPNSLPLLAVFIGERCDAEIVSLRFAEYQKFRDLIFPNESPEFDLQSWTGGLEYAEHIYWQLFGITKEKKGIRGLEIITDL